MKRPLAILAAAVATIAGLTPAVTAAAAAPTPAASATVDPIVASTPTPTLTYPQFPEPPRVAHPTFPKTTARWVNGTLTVAFGFAGAFHTEGVSDSDTYLKVDGKVVEDLLERGLSGDVVTIPRAASAGPARVEVIASDFVELGSFDSTYSTTVYSASVRQQVAKAKKGQVSAASLLRKLKVAKESHAGSYLRSKFRLWVDANRDGENTRAEVLKAESKRRVTENSRHTVKTGKWVSAYDGKTFTVASKLDIDHLVPLQEAWTSGAASWSMVKRTAYANDLGYAASLIAVSKHANRSKGDKEPNGYLPAKTSYRCAYVRNYIAVKYRWGLTVDTTEHAALKTDLATYCTNPYVAKPGKPNLTALAGSPKKTSGGGAGGGSTGGSSVYYKNCDAVRAAGKAPLYRGQPGYATPRPDRDGDGVACE